MSIFKKISRKINSFERKVHNFILRKQVKNKDFTIIAQNCIAGVIYSQLKMEFKSPTINMFIEDENFVKLVENLEYYMSLDPKPYNECFIDPIDSKIKYPKIILGDIEICCLHYANCSEAIEA